MTAVERFESGLTSYAARLVGNLEAARDLVQETFLKLCRQDRQSVEHKLAEWLYTVCRNLALDTRRKDRRLTPLTDEDVARMRSAEAPAVETLEEREEGFRMLRALAHLPENQQEVIRLKFQHGLSYKEISRITKLSVSNVGYLIHIGLKAVRREVAGDRS